MDRLWDGKLQTIDSAPKPTFSRALAHLTRRIPRTGKVLLEKGQASLRLIRHLNSDQPVLATPLRWLTTTPLWPLLWMDEIHFAPPKKPWNEDSPVTTCKQRFLMVSRRCRISSIHSVSENRQVPRQGGTQMSAQSDVIVLPQHTNFNWFAAQTPLADN